VAGLEGTIKTPFGTVQKKTALALGGIALALGGIVYWREKKLGGLTPSTTNTAGEVDPATGFVYGTPEDLAALAAQGTDLGGGNPPTPGGSGSIPAGGTVGTGYTSNGQWVQAVEQYMLTNNLVSEPTQLSAALGKYITGAYIDPKDIASTSLVQQAISVEGYPPIAGPNGYPPAINTHPGTTTPPVTTPGTPKPPVKIPPKVLPKRRYVVVAPFVTGHILWNATLSGIAGKSHRTVSQLASWNGISNPNVIGTGKHIWIDSATGFSGSVEWKG